jgi:site-specific DNA recombinase
MANTEAPAIRRSTGIWIRVSTEDQARGDSPEHHERRAKCYAESRGWDVAEVYHLEAVSGKSVMDHPEAKRMLDDVRKGKITGLIFSKLARLARNTKELLEFADIFRELGADLISLQESIDTSTPAGRLFYTIIAAMAQWEREEIADRVSASLVIRAKMGKPLNGKSSYGYVWVDKKLVPDPVEAPIRKMVYELYVKHRRKKAVARILNDGGYRTRDGSKWSDTTVDRLIRDPTAKGLHRANYTKKTTGKRNWLIKPEEDWVWTRVDPVVGEELWDECNALLDGKSRKRPRGRRPVHLFAGYTVCECSRRMYVPSNSRVYRCWTCGNRIPIDDLEAVYVEQLKAFFVSPETIAAHLAGTEEKIEEKEDLLKALESEYAKLKREVDRVYRLYVDEQMAGDAFAKFYKPLEERQKQLDQEIPSLQAEIDVLRVNCLSGEEVVAEAQDLYSRWSSLETDEKRRIIESITERIVIGQDEIDITLCQFPAPEPSTKRQRCLWDSSRQPT